MKRLLIAVGVLYFAWFTGLFGMFGALAHVILTTPLLYVFLVAWLVAMVKVPLVRSITCGVFVFCALLAFGPRNAHDDLTTAALLSD